jgi:hypothetical protein
MVHFKRNRQSYSWGEIKKLGHSDWKAVTLDKEEMTDGWVQLHYSIASKWLPLQSGLKGESRNSKSSKNGNSKIIFCLKMRRSRWRNIVDPYLPQKNRDDSLGKEELPSYEEHPRYKQLFGRPAGRFMSPIDKQASNLFKRGDQKS